MKLPWFHKNRPAFSHVSVEYENNVYTVYVNGEFSGSWPHMEDIPWMEIEFTKGGRS